MKNLARVSEMLMTATSTKVGDPCDELEEVYGRMVAQWTTEMNHVVRVVGGFDSQQKHIGQQGVRFVTVPQAAAGRGGAVPAGQRVPDADVHDPARHPAPIQPTGIVDRVRTAQNSASWAQLLQAARLDRMAEQVALDGERSAYPPLQFLTDLRAGVWSELAKPGTPIDIYRRNLQRAYLDNMDARLNGAGRRATKCARSSAASCTRSTSRFRRRCRGATDEVTRRHLQDAAIRSPRRSIRGRCARARQTRRRRPRRPRRRPLSGVSAGRCCGRGGWMPRRVLTLWTDASRAQLAAPGPSGVAMGHLHLGTKDARRAASSGPRWAACRCRTARCS